MPLVLVFAVATLACVLHAGRTKKRLDAEAKQRKGRRVRVAVPVQRRFRTI